MLTATLGLAQPPGPSPSQTSGPWNTNSGAAGLSQPDPNWSSDGAGADPWWMGVPSNFYTVRIAHAALAASAFLLVFPLGGIIIHVSNHPQVVWVHAGIQALGYIVFAVATRLGIWMARKIDCV